MSKATIGTALCIGLLCLTGPALSQRPQNVIPMIWHRLSKNAVHFNGLGGLALTQDTRGGGLYNLPRTSDRMFGSYWYRSDTPIVGGYYESFIFAGTESDTSSYAPIFVSHLLWGSDVYVFVGIEIFGIRSSTGENVRQQLIWYAPTSLNYSLTWCEVFFSISKLGVVNRDGSSGATVQDIVACEGESYYVENLQLTSNFDMSGVSWRGMDFSRIAAWQVGGDVVNNSQYYNGDLSEVYFDFTTPQDLTSPTVVSRFRSSAGRAVGLGSDWCNGITGAAANVCLRGDPTFFPRGPFIPNTFDRHPPEWRLTPVKDDPCDISSLNVVPNGCR